MFSTNSTILPTALSSNVNTRLQSDVQGGIDEMMYQSVIAPISTEHSF